MARRIASSGYYVLLPDLYYRFEPGFVTDFTEESMKIMSSYEHFLNHKMIISDFESLLYYAKNESVCNDSLVGTVGYCMSGPFAFRLASQFPEIIKCAASIHGVSLFTEDNESPHLFANKITGEIYFACAENDSYAPTEMINKLNDYLKKINIKYKIETYPGTDMGLYFHKESASMMKMLRKNTGKDYLIYLIEILNNT